MKWRGNGGETAPGAYCKCGKASLAVVFAFAAVFAFSVSTAQARDAAFINPGSAVSASDDAIRVEPKGDIDVGDSVLNVTRRTDLFFVNQSDGPVKVEKVTVNGDGNVATDIVSDDCSKQGTIQPGSRCSVEVALTPSSPGAWTAEVLMTHDGNGRIARAKIMGKTSGTASVEKKEMGLALDTKETTPVNFGSVEVDGGKAVRSALMINDSNDPITLYAIDVIEASNGLQRLDQGCAVDMELKPGESCPVTLVWTPTGSGQISTDLIIRHSGRLGFAVIPIRGVAKGAAKGDNTETQSNDSGAGGKSAAVIPPPLPPSVLDIEKAAGDKIPAVSAGDMKVAETTDKAAVKPSGKFVLIGTVGNRAIILKPDSKTAIVSSGDDLSTDFQQAQVIQVSAKSVDLMLDGKKKTIILEASPVLIEKAKLASQSETASSKEKDMDFSAQSVTATSATSGSGAAGSSISGAKGNGSVSGAPK